MTTRSKPSPSAIAACVVAGLCAVEAWYPFKADPPRVVSNGAHRLLEGAIDFAGPSRVFSRNAFLVQGAPDELVITAELARADQSGPARLIDVGSNPYAPGFIIGVVQDTLVVRLPCDGQGESEWQIPYTPGRQLSVSLLLHGLAPGRTASLRVNGEHQAELSNRCPQGRQLRWPDAQTPWTLGNVYSGHRPFVGRLLEVSVVRNTARVDALRDIAWEMPESFWFWPERLYEPFSLDEWGEVLVAAYHFAVFWVFGRLLRVARPRAGNIRLLLLAVALSCTVNAGKVLVAGRHPSVLDLVLNLLGAAAAIHAKRAGSARATRG
jgi:hypothetical protein